MVNVFICESVIDATCALLSTLKFVELSSIRSVDEIAIIWRVVKALTFLVLKPATCHVCNAPT